MEVVSRTVAENRTILNITAVNVSDLYDRCYWLRGDVHTMYLSGLHIFVTLIGLVSNSYMVVKLNCLKRLERKSVRDALRDADFFFSKLGLCNIVTTLTIPAWVTQTIFPKGWMFGMGLCKLLKGFNTFSWQYGILILLHINVERYMKVVHNRTTFKYLTQKSRSSFRRGIARSLAIAPLISAIVDVCYYNVVQVSQNTKMCYDTMYPNSRIVTFWIKITLFFIIPLVVLLYCNIKILCFIRNHSKNTCFSITTKRIRIVPFLTGMFFFCCWIPWIVSTVYYRWHVGCAKAIVLNISVVIGNLHCFTTPTLYIVTRIHKFARKYDSFKFKERTNASFTQ